MMLVFLDIRTQSIKDAPGCLGCVRRAFGVRHQLLSTHRQGPASQDPSSSESHFELI
jgi:hypothetical protein